MAARHTPFFCYLAVLIALAGTAEGQNRSVALLLFDGESGTDFVGCLNCNRFDSAAVCNRFGEFGSGFSSQSIWNGFGSYGSRFSTNSPWNRFGQGLRIVDFEGNYYGRFSLNPSGQTRIPFVLDLLRIYEAFGDLSGLRDLYCE